MTDFYIGAAFFLFLNMLAGMIRVVRGPSTADRIMATQLFGTTGVAILLLLAQAFEVAAVRNVALVFVLLAVLATVAFTSRSGFRREDSEREDAK